MPAVFPNSVRVYTAKTDLIDTVLAEHVNLLQDEVTAVENTLGTGLLSSSWSGTFSSPSTHASVSARIANIEAGILSRAPFASPTFTGVPAAPTASADTSTTQVATTAFVLGQAGSATPLVNGTAAVGTSLRYARQDHVHGTDTSRAPLASPTFTGTVTLPLATAGFVKTTSGGVISSTSSVAQSEVTNLVSDLALKAPLASPTFTGTPKAPTALSTDNSTQIATTAWVAGQNFVKGDGSVSNAATATKLATARTITLSGDVTGSTSFDGSANVTINTVSKQADSFVAAFFLGGI